jgi:hypothetical protein
MAIAVLVTAGLLMFVFGIGAPMARLIRMELRWDLRLARTGLKLFFLGVVFGSVSCLGLLWYFGHLA